MTTTRWLLAAAFVVTFSFPAAGEPPTADNLLTAFEKSVEKLARVRIDENSKREGDTEVEMTLFRDGPRLKLDRLVQPKGDRSRRFREQTLIGDDIVLLRLQYNALDDAPQIVGVSALLERLATRSWFQIGYPQVIFGRIEGDAGYPLWTVMRESDSLERLPATEIVDGCETHIVRSRGKFGTHRLWLDPASGGLPRRIEVSKQPGDLVNDEQLGTSTAPNPPAEPPTKRRIPVRRPRSEYWGRIDNIQIENQKGSFVITGFDTHVGTTFVGETSQKSDADKKPRFNWERAYEFRVVVDPQEFPEDAFRFAIAIPNRTPITVLDSAPLENQRPVNMEHEWMDGKVVKQAGK